MGVAHGVVVNGCRMRRMKPAAKPNEFTIYKAVCHESGHRVSSCSFEATTEAMLDHHAWRVTQQPPSLSDWQQRLVDALTRAS